jgi:hypothetical protein
VGGGSNRRLGLIAAINYVRFGFGARLQWIEAVWKRQFCVIAS